MGLWVRFIYLVYITQYGNMGNIDIKPIKIDDRNRVTLPKWVLDDINCKSGDFVAFEKSNGRNCIYKAFFGVRRNNGNGNCKSD